VAPKTFNHENASKHPVPLPFRGIMVAMVANIFKPGDKKVLSIAEINGLISAGMNIHRNILPYIRIDKDTSPQESQILITANKLAVLVGDVLLAKANSLTANLENPKAAAKISDMLSEISQNSVDTMKSTSSDEKLKDHSILLWKECCETVVMVAGGDQEEYRIVGQFIEQVGKSYVSLVEEDNSKSFDHKMKAMQYLDELESYKQEMAENINLIRSLTQAFLPIDWVEPQTVKI